MAEFGAVYQGGQMIASRVQMARRVERGAVQTRWRIQAILPRPLADRVAAERLRQPVYQIEFDGQTEDYFVAGEAIPISANPDLLRQDFLSLDHASGAP